MQGWKSFLNDERGAVTVDWVVLTSAVVILAAVVAPPIRSAVVAIAIDIGDTVGIGSDWLASVPN